MFRYVMGQEPRLANTIGGLLESKLFHYFNQNGRIADFFVQIFAGFDAKWLFDICNTVILFFFLDCINDLVSPRRKELWIVAVTWLFILLVIPVPARAIMRMSGSCNYFWAITFTLLLMRYLRRHYREPVGCGRGVLLAFCSLLAGNMNESVTATVLAAGFFHLIFHRGKFTPMARLIGCFYLIGLIIIVVSPSMWARMEYDNAVTVENDILLFLRHRASNFVKSTLQYATPAAAWLAMLYILICGGWRRVVDDWRCCLMTGAGLVVLVLAVTTPRFYTAYSVFSFILLLAVANEMLDRFPRAKTLLAVLAVLAAVYPSYRAAEAIDSYRRFNDAVIAEIRQAPPQAILGVKEWPGTNRWVKPAEYDSFIFRIYNIYYCYAYGKENVQFVRPDVMARYRGKEDFTLGCDTLPFTVDRPDIASCILSPSDTSEYVIIPMADLKNIFQDPEVVKLDDAQAYYYHIVHNGKYYIITTRPKPDVKMLRLPALDADTLMMVNFTKKL